MTEKSFFVYVLANPTNTVTYVGVTSDLIRRVWEHKDKTVPGFTSKYNVGKLVYYEQLGESLQAIGREKEIKGWRRSKKVALIESINPDWRDLYSSIL
jgi:putative endonuclease